MASDNGLPASDDIKHEHIARTVVRANEYVHVAFDNCYVFDLGQDIEISALRVDPRPRTLKQISGLGLFGTETTIENNVSEVARFRMGSVCASHMAMNLLKALVERGDINTDALSKNIEEMIRERDSLVSSEPLP